MSRPRIMVATLGILALVFVGVLTQSLLNSAGSDGTAWKLGTPTDLELAGRPQLVEFFHPL